MLYTKCVKTSIIIGIDEVTAERNLGNWIAEQDESPIIIWDEKRFKDDVDIYYIRVRYITVKDYNKYHVKSY